MLRRYLRLSLYAVVGLVALVYLGLVVSVYLPYEEVPRATLLSEADELIDVDGVSMRYRRYGNGDPSLPNLVLIHGFANSLQSYRAFSPLVAGYFNVYALDLPGYGLSEKPVEFDYGNAAQGEMVAKFAAALELESFIVGGHSLGGAIALHTAAIADNCTGLVLFNPGILTTGVPSLTQHLFFPLQRLSARQFGNREFRASFLRQSYVDPSIVTEEVVDDVMKGSRMEGYLAGMTSLMDQYEEGAELPLLPKFEKPTLIVWGVEDKNKPAGEADDLNGRIKGSQLVEIAEAGHYVHEEKPVLSAAAVISARGWLSGLANDSAASSAP